MGLLRDLLEEAGAGEEEEQLWGQESGAGGQPGWYSQGALVKGKTIAAEGLGAILV